MSNRPSGVMPLTKAQILNGRNYTERVYIPALEGEVVIRVLTAGETARAGAMETRDLSMSMDLAGDKKQIEESMALDINIEDMLLNEHRSNVYVAACGLSVGDDTWTEDDVEAIKPAEALEQIAKEVRRISKISGSMMENIAQFRGDPGRATDHVTAHVRDAIGIGSIGTDGGAGGVSGDQHGSNATPEIQPSYPGEQSDPTA